MVMLAARPFADATSTCPRAKSIPAFASRPRSAGSTAARRTTYPSPSARRSAAVRGEEQDRPARTGMTTRGT
jgi:hypothetical protein